MKNVWIFRKIKVRTRIALLLAILLMISSLLTGGLLRGYIRSRAQDSMYRYLISTQKQAVNGIELFLDDVIMLSLRVRMNQELYRIQSSKELSRAERTSRTEKILSDIISGNESGSVAAVQLIFSNGTYSASCTEGLQLSLPPPTVMDQIQKTVFYVCADPVEDTQKNSYIPIGLMCSDYYTGQRLGCLILYVRTTALEEIYNGMLTDMGYSYIVDEHSQDYFISETEMAEAVQQHQVIAGITSYPYINVVDLEEGRSVLAVQKLSRRMQDIGFKWQIVSVVPHSQLFSAEIQMQRTLLLLEIVILGVSIMTVLRLSSRLTESLKRLQDKLTELGNGRLDSLIDDEPRDEIWELENSYNEMAVRINDLIQKNMEEKERERQMEFAALQAQINPHFLYNTLDALGWIARIKKQEEIEQMVLELANFFRMSLHKGDRLITIEDEIQLVKSFATIEQMRNPDKFDITFSVEPVLSKELIPKIILQPIVENAIKHGVYELRRKGYIEVRVYHEGNDIFMEVEDDGKGFDASYSSFKGCEYLKHSGYGLKNVAERIRLEYGPGYGVNVKSEPGKNTIVQLKLCFHSTKVEEPVTYL